MEGSNPQPPQPAQSVAARVIATKPIFEDAPRQQSLLQLVFMIIRLVVFLSIILVSGLYLFPVSTLFSIPLPWLFVGIIGFAILFGGFFYFLTFSRTSLMGTAFDIEAMGVVIIGMIALVFLIVVMITTSSQSKTTIFGLILMAIYTFYVYKVIKDTFTLKRENEKIRNKFAELEQVDREKSDFILITSHQLRTPLTEVRWAVESALRGEGLAEDTKTILTRGLQSADQLKHIVNEMLNARLLEENNHVLKVESFDLVKVIDEIVSELGLFANQKQVTVTFARPEKEVLLEADKQKLKIVLENLIDNGIRYAPKGTVSIAMTGERNTASISIQDTGIGIAEEDFGRMFTKFFRGKNAVLTQPDGSGIGLYAAKKIIEQHGGSLTFFSELEKGTTFRVNLPLHQPK